MHTLQELLSSLIAANSWFIAVLIPTILIGVYLRRIPPILSAAKRHPLFFASTELFLLPALYTVSYTFIYWLIVKKFALPEEDWPIDFFNLCFTLLISWILGKIIHAFVSLKHAARPYSASNYISGLYRWLIYGGALFLGLGFFSGIRVTHLQGCGSQPGWQQLCLVLHCSKHLVTFLPA